MGWFIADLKTGQVLIRDLPVSKGSVAPVLNKAGVIQASVRLPMRVQLGSRASTIDPGLIQPGRTVLGLEANGVILDAGPVWEDSFNWDGWELNLTAAGLRSLFEHRFVLPAGVSTPVGADTVLSGWSLRTIAKKVVQQALAWTNGSLPIVYDEADISGSAERTYKGVDLQTVNEVLAKLSGVDGGPDVDFRPEFNADRTAVQWRMVTGAPELKQSGAAHVWDGSVPKSPVRAASRKRMADVLTSKDWAVGGTPDGSDSPIVAVGSDSTLTAAGFPLLESTQSRNSVITQSVLAGHAAAAVAVGKQYLTQYEFAVSTEPEAVLPNGKTVKAAPWLGDYRPGDYGVLRLPVSPLSDVVQSVNVRLLGYSYSHGDESVKFTCAESRASV